MKTKMKSISGYTLLELMITVVIIGIVTTMAVPRFSIAYDRMQFRTANRDIISTIRTARSTAISNKAVCGVHFDASTKVLSVFRKDPASTNPILFESGDSLLSADTLSSTFATITTDLANSVMSFKPNGSAIYVGGGNIVTLTYTDDLVGIYEINVLASTGRVSSQGYYY